MQTDPRVGMVVNEMNGILRRDGGEATLLGVDDGIAQVRYNKGENEACAECVMSPEDFRLFLLESLQRKAPHIKDVEIQLS